MKKNKSALSNYQKFPMLILLVSLVMSIGYATISSITLDLEGEVIAKENEGVFITEINCQNNNGATTHSYSAYESNFKSSISLSNSENTSKVICEIIMYNPDEEDYYYFGEEYLVGEETYSNTDITYALSGIEKGYLLQAKNYVTFTITFHYLNDVIATNNNLNSMINFMFKKGSLNALILLHNDLIISDPTLTDSSNNTSDKSGLYSSTATTNGKVTYYFRGDVKNNYVKFADLTWKIIRINEDGSVRLMLNDRVGGTAHVFKDEAVTFEDMYYSYGSNAKAQVDNWYATTIANTKYDEYVVNGIFCEQAKAKISESWTSGNADMIYFKNYEPNFDCDPDGNGRGLLLNADGSRAKVGLITYDEMVHAGGYHNKENKNYYLYNGSYGIWSMSPGGFSSTAYLWMMRTQGILIDRHVKYGYNLQPVINIKGDLKAIGNGKETTPYEVLI